MDLIIAPGTVPAISSDTIPATGTPQYATNGVPGTTPPTQFPAYHYMGVVLEILNVITNSGQTANRFNLDQLLQAVQFFGGAYVVDTGAVNAIAVTLNPVPGSLNNLVGMPIRVKVANTPTGSFTVNVNGLGALPVLDRGGLAFPAVTGAGAILAGDIGTFIYNGTGFVLHSETGRLLNVQIFSNAGTFTYTPTPGTNSVIVEVQGGGAAGGGSQATSSSQSVVAGGGGAGGYAKSRLLSGFSGAAVVVGSGGVPVVGGNGGNGNSSSFGGVISSFGGLGSSVGISTNTFPSFSGYGQPGESSGGNIINASGNSGATGFSAALVAVLSGPGGGSIFGGGGRAQVTGGAGVAALSFGAGGSGAAAGASQPALAGGAGQNGIVIISEYA